MVNKNRSFVVVMLLFSVLFFAGCSNTGNAASEVETINLYAGGSDNVRTTWEEVINAFNEENEDVEVKLQFIPSGAGAQSAVDKLIASEIADQEETDMDIVEVSDGDIVKIFKETGEDTIEALTEKDIPNIKNVKYQPEIEEKRALPFRGTTVVLAYNSDKVKDVPETDQELYQWIKDNPGRFAYNDPTTGGSGSSFLVTTVYNQMPEEAITSDDPKWVEQWDKGFALLEELHPYLYKASGKVQYPSKNQGTLDLLADGQVDMIPAWADMTLEQLGKGTLPNSIKITQIKPELNGNLEYLAIPSKGKNKEAAKQFLNFVVSEKGQNIFLNSMKAIPVIEASNLSQESLEMLNGFEIDAFRGYSIGELGNDLKKRWQEDIATLE